MRLYHTSRKSPATDCQIASAARAAVSARRMRGPSVTGVTKGSARNISRSAGSKPPSGPVRMAAGPSCRARLPPAAWRRRPRHKNKAAALSARTPAIFPAPRSRGFPARSAAPDCSAASMALAAMRSLLMRLTMVRRVKTGCSTPRPARSPSAPDNRTGSSSPARRPATGPARRLAVASASCRSGSRRACRPARSQPAIRRRGH